MLETPKSVKIFNEFNLPEAKPAPVGDGFVDVYDYVNEEDKATGEVKVVYKVVGKSNLYELIQASKDSTDIHYIVDRVSKGDTSLLNAKQGIFCDTSEMPKDVFELEGMSNQIRKVYEGDLILKNLYKSYEDYEKAFLKGEVFDAYISACKAVEEANKANTANNTEVNVNEAQPE